MLINILWTGTSREGSSVWTSFTCRTGASSTGNALRRRDQHGHGKTDVITNKLDPAGTAKVFTGSLVA